MKAVDIDELTGIEVPRGGETVSVSFEPWDFPEFSAEMAARVAEIAVKLSKSETFMQRIAESRSGTFNFDPTQPPELTDIFEPSPYA